MLIPSTNAKFFEERYGKAMLFMVFPWYLAQPAVENKLSVY